MVALNVGKSNILYAGQVVFISVLEAKASRAKGHSGRGVYFV